MKKLILSHIFDKKNFTYENIRGEYFPAINKPMHVRLEHYSLFINETFVINYLYLSKDCVSMAVNVVDAELCNDPETLEKLKNILNIRK